MKKTTLLAALLLSTGVTASFAQTTGPELPKVSTETETHYYFVKNADNTSYYVTYASTETPVQLTSGTSKDKAVIFTVSNGTAEGNYTINAVNITTGQSLPVTYVDSQEGANKVKASAPGTTENAEWTLTAGEAGFAISPVGEERSWNMWGGAGQALGLWGSKADKGSTWIFTEVTPTDFQQLVTLVEKEYENWNTALTTASTGKNLGTVGFPTDAASSTFKDTVEGLITAAKEDNAKAFTLNGDFQNALATLKSSIVMPEDGGAYRLVTVFEDEARFALTWDGTDLNRISGVSETASGAELPAATTFYTHKVGDRYLFVNKDGKYLNWFDPGADDPDKKGDGTGATDAYDAAINLWTLEPADVSGAVALATGTSDATLLGRFQLKGNTKGGKSYYLNPRQPGDNNQAFDFVSQGQSNKFYDKNGRGQHRSFTFVLEEVKPETSCALKVTDAGLATYSTPFPTTIPEGLEAYTAQYDAANATLNLTKVEDGIVPEGVGVIIKGNAGNYNPVPATADGTATTSALTATKGDPATVDAATTAYVLGTVSGETGFYKLSESDRTIGAFKAYLTLSDAAAAAIRLNFDGMATGIDGLIVTDSAKAPVYDLSGRRVIAPVKGGIYIQAGKKFIVK